MGAIAIDGARAYAMRRDLQSAVDAAALAAADKLQQSRSYSSAEQTATNVFSTNLRLYSTPSCSPGYGSPSASPFAVTCTYSDGTTLTQIVSGLGPQGSQFTISATRSLALQFARVLASVSPTLAAAAGGGVNNLVYTPAVAALDPDGCGGVSGAALTINGSGTLNVNGDVVSNGAISVLNATMRVAGDIYSRCQGSVAGASPRRCRAAASCRCHRRVCRRRGSLRRGHCPGSRRGLDRCLGAGNRRRAARAGAGRADSRHELRRARWCGGA